MGEEQERAREEGWLEVEGGDGEARLVRCPRHDAYMPLSACLACARYQSLTMDAQGKHVYIACDWQGNSEPPSKP